MDCSPSLSGGVGLGVGLGVGVGVGVGSGVCVGVGSGVGEGSGSILFLSNIKKYAEPTPRRRITTAIIIIF